MSPPTITIAKGRCESEPIRVKVQQGADPKCDQHCNHNGSKPEHSPFYGRLLNRVASGPKLIYVFNHDDAGLYRHTEKRKKANA